MIGPGYSSEWISSMNAGADCELRQVLYTIDDSVIHTCRQKRWLTYLHISTGKWPAEPCCVCSERKQWSDSFWNCIRSFPCSPPDRDCTLWPSPSPLQTAVSTDTNRPSSPYPFFLSQSGRAWSWCVEANPPTISMDTAKLSCVTTICIRSMTSASRVQTPGTDCDEKKL